MRTLALFAAGYTAACALGAYMGLTGYGFWLAVGLMAAAFAVFAFSKQYPLLSKVCAVCLGASIGLCCFSLHGIYVVQQAAKLDGQTQTVSVLVTEFSYETQRGAVADGELTIEGKRYKVRLYLDGEEALEPGDRVEGNFRFRLTAEGGVSEPTYHRSDGIFLLAYQQDAVQVTPAHQIPLQCIPGLWQGKLTGLLDRVLPEDVLGFVKALLLGDRSDLSYDVRTDLKVAGISHVVAVSGLHVSILFSLVQLLTGRRRWLTALLGIPAVVLFAAVAGFTPSVTRAAVMQIIMMLAVLLDREYDPFTALSAAVLCMLAVNPLVIESVSFQLSVGCIVGIFLFAEKIRGFLLSEKVLGQSAGRSLWAKLRRYVASGIGVTVSAMVATTPLVAYYFGAVSLVGILTNLLTLWVISYTFYGGLLLCLLGYLYLPLGVALGWLLAWPVRYVLAVADGLSRVPLAAVYTCSGYIVLWLVLVYILLVFYLQMKQKRPVVLCCCAVISLCVAVLAGAVEPLLYEHKVTALSVGQGQSIVLQSKGKTFVVDCGGDDDEEAADLVAETLLSQGISRIDGLILTHADLDHAGGAPYLLQRIRADAVIAPAQAAEKLEFAGEGILLAEQDYEIAFPGGNITIFVPEKDAKGNESSAAVLFQTEKCDTLITGDLSRTGEIRLLRRASIPELEVLVVGHHGSENSTSEYLLEQTSPEVAIISVGEGNWYGHPHDSVLQRLENAGCRIYRTDLHGTILFGR
jgi:competence protein ComEC